jgi:hypothetical protein
VFELSALLALVWNYFAVVVRGHSSLASSASAAIMASIVLVKAAVIGYGVWRVARRLRGWVRQRSARSSVLSPAGNQDPLLADDALDPGSPSQAVELANG